MKRLTCPGTTPLVGEDIRKVIRYAIAKGKGASTFFCLGTTGEAKDICLTAKKSYIDIAVDEIRKLKSQFYHNSGLNLDGHPKRNLELSIGVTHEDINKTVELAQYAENAGADYAVVMPVFITKNRIGEFSRKIGNNLRTLLNKTQEIKFILYNYPGMTGRKNIRTVTWKEFSKDPRIARLKDSSGDRQRAINYKKAADGNAEVDVGNEILGLKMQASGIVAGSANILPIPWNMAVFEDCSENMIAAQVAEKLVRFQKVYAQNPIGAFKYIQWKLGVIDSPKTFNEEFAVNQQFARKLDELMLDQDFETMLQLCAA